MKSRVASHEVFDAIEIVGVNGLLQLANFLEGIDVGFEFRPAGEAEETSDLDLGIGKRFCATGLEKILGLIFQVAEIRTFGKRARLVGRIGRHATSFHLTPVVRKSGRKKVRENGLQTGGLLPFPRTGCVPNARTILSRPDSSN